LSFPRSIPQNRRKPPASDSVSNIALRRHPATTPATSRHFSGSFNAGILANASYIFLTSDKNKTFFWPNLKKIFLFLCQAGNLPRFFYGKNSFPDFHPRPGPGKTPYPWDQSEKTKKPRLFCFEKAGFDGEKPWTGEGGYFHSSSLLLARAASEDWG